MVSFSVIIPLYNKESAIRDTLSSVLCQEYKEVEIVVVDDGSTDCSADIVKSFNNDKIRYFWKENGGVSSARNYGMSLAKNEWILFLDADDLMSKDALSMLNNMIQNYPGYKVYSGNMRLYGGLRCKEFSELAKVSNKPFNLGL